MNRFLGSTVNITFFFFNCVPDHCGVFGNIIAAFIISKTSSALRTIIICMEEGVKLFQRIIWDPIALTNFPSVSHIFVYNIGIQIHTIKGFIGFKYMLGSQLDVQAICILI